MANNQIRPLARLFRGMADLIDRDHSSQTRYEAIAKAAGVVAGPRHRPGAGGGAAVAGRRRRSAGSGLRLPRRAAAPGGHGRPRPGHAAAGAGVRWRPASAAPFPARSAWDGRLGRLDGAAGFPASSIAPPLDPHRLPGPRLGELDPADVAKLWALVSELPGSQVIPRGQLIRLTGFIPADLAARLLRLLDGGPQLVGTQTARIRNLIDPNNPATPALAVLVLGWLEAAQEVLAAGSSSQELQVLLSVADRQD